MWYFEKKIDPFIKLSYNAQIATLILADLDLHKDSEHLKNIWMNGRKITNRFLLIVAVREIESWLLADSDSFEKWSSVPKNKIVSNPDSIQDVKQNLLNLISKYAKSEIQRDLLPSKGNLTSKVGIAYNSRLVNYIDNYWDPEIARHRSNSLDYALKELEDFKKEYP